MVLLRIWICEWHCCELGLVSGHVVCLDEREAPLCVWVTEWPFFIGLMKGPVVCSG